MPAKRKRSLCSDAPPLPAVSRVLTPPTHDRLPPLTSKNLHLLDAANEKKIKRRKMSQATRSSGRKSPTKPSISSGDATFRLSGYGIHIMRDKQRPANLESLVTKLQDTPRTTESPNAKEIVRLQSAAVLEAEDDGIRLLEDLLLTRDAHHLHGQKFVRVLRKQNLSRAYIPQFEDPSLPPLYAQLEQPQPDSMIGYMNRDIAEAVRVDTLFTNEEERITRRFSLCADAQFPFLTCQWKSTRNGGTHVQARYQGARDGATVVNYLRTMHAIALPGSESDPTRTCHFSATCDLETIRIYVHWHHIADDGRASFEMDSICQGFCNDVADMRRVRRVMRNIIDDALERRLSNIRSIIPGLRTAAQKGALLPPSLPSGSIASPRSSAGASSIISQGLDMLPPTPTTIHSDTSSPPAKRTKVRQDVDG